MRRGGSQGAAVNGWTLPTSVRLGSRRYGHQSDFRRILTVLQVLGDAGRPEFLRWHMALHLFYEAPIPRELEPQAMEYLASFLTCGARDAPGPKLFDWERDAHLIVADVNAVAGRELRAEPYVHWWTFLGWFRAVGQGQFSLVVSLRDKLRRGEKLESWEREYCRRNPGLIRQAAPDTPEQAAEKQRLLALLDGR